MSPIDVYVLLFTFTGLLSIIGEQSKRNPRRIAVHIEEIKEEKEWRNGRLIRLKTRRHVPFQTRLRHHQKESQCPNFRK
jgi:hypothetical protein